MVRNGRKSIWDTPSGSKTVATEAEQDISASIAPTVTAPAPAVPIVEQLRMAEEKKRDRTWERSNKTHSYWGIPVELRQALGWAAGELNVKIDDVARAFLEYGLEEYQGNPLTLNPYPNPKGQKMTLYPRGWDHQPWKREKWSSKPPKPYLKSTTRRKLNDMQKKDPTCVLAVRNIPEELHGKIVAIAEARSLPVGEIATLFLGCGLQAYSAGILALNPMPVTTAHSLFSGEQ